MSALTAQQRRVLTAPGVTRIGTEARNRPVVQAMSGIPGQLRFWAVKRDGDPTDPAEPISFLTPKQVDGGAS